MWELDYMLHLVCHVQIGDRMGQEDYKKGLYFICLYNTGYPSHLTCNLRSLSMTHS